MNNRFDSVISNVDKLTEKINDQKTKNNNELDKLEIKKNPFNIHFNELNIANININKLKETAFEEIKDSQDDNVEITKENLVPELNLSELVNQTIIQKPIIQTKENEEDGTETESSETEEEDSDVDKNKDDKLGDYSKKLLKN